MAYARAVTDGATFAWLCDVFVDSSVRGQGIGHCLVNNACVALETLRLKRILLATADAHALYSEYGFEPIANPERWMSKARLA